MKNIIFALSILTFLSACKSSPAPTTDPTPGATYNGRFYKYSELVIRDYDEMSKVVTRHVKAARKMTSGENEDESGAQAELREALKLIFSRPNSDNMVAKLTPEVRRELVGMNVYESTIHSLTKEGIAALNDDNLPVVTQATYLFMLENILSEIKPEAQNNNDLRTSIEMIKEAKIKLSDEVKRDRKMRSMYPPFDPSEEARKALDGIKRARDKEAKEEAKRAKEKKE